LDILTAVEISDLGGVRFVHTQLSSLGLLRPQASHRGPEVSLAPYYLHLSNWGRLKTLCNGLDSGRYQ